MRKEYIWEVKAHNTPLLKRSCSHCDSDRFYCSEKFRMNAQKKNIDVWLIYRCIKCDNTYNMTIISRASPESINKELFHRFQENNRELAWQYAFSTEIRKKNNVEADFDTIKYEIQYEQRFMENLHSTNEDTLSFKVIYAFSFQLKLSTVIRNCLKLSSKQLDRLITMQAITVHGKFLEKKHRVKHEDIVKISCEALKRITR